MAAHTTSRARLEAFNPGSEAEPPTEGTLDTPQDGRPAAGDAAAADATPSVLNKLQKWADYEAMGRPVAPTRFIPCKTPMSLEILDNWSLEAAPRHALTVPLLLSAQAAQGRTVGLILDLANHDCLYSDDMPPSLEYEHVQLVAKVLPSRAAVDEVQRIAQSFWADSPDRYIAIHCAYGFNRTGFVVCSYLCQACGLSVDAALESFAAARPPGVKHEKFIRELYARYGDGPPSAACPTPVATPQADGQLAAADATPGAHEPAAADGAWQQQPLSPPQQPPQQTQPLSPQQQAQRQAQEEQPEHEEDQHFEDAAAMVRRGSQHRRSSSARSGDLAGGSPVASSRTPSRAGSAASSRNPSRHGGSLAELAQLAEPVAPDPPGDEAVATEPGVGFAASRRLLQRKPSRGGGLSAALVGGSPLRGASPSPAGSCGSAAAGGASPTSGVRTSASSFSDLAAAASHLEGANSMRRTTSLGLAKALCEDFLQHNGSPGAALPVAAAVDGERLVAADPRSEGQAAPGVSGTAAASQQQQQQQQQQQSAGAAPSGSGGSCSTRCDVPAAGSPTKSDRSPSLGSSPSRRGGIPLPPLRPPAAQAQVAWLAAAAGQPGTPATPASSATPSALSGSQRMPRSCSVDSENPSLGFGMREALHHLRRAAAGDVRPPEALADLFRDDSNAELAALDVEEHLQALALADSSGLESPAAAARLRSGGEPAGAAARGAPPQLTLGPAAGRATPESAAPTPRLGQRLTMQHARPPQPPPQQQQQQPEGTAGGHGKCALM